MLNELEALGLVMGQACLEEHRVHAELRVEQGHVAVHFHEEVDALVPLVEVRVVVRERLGAAGATERPTRGHLRGAGGERGRTGHFPVWVVHFHTDVDLALCSNLQQVEERNRMTQR